MFRGLRAVPILCLVLLLSAAGAPLLAQGNRHIADTDPLTPEEEQKKLQVPPGFKITLVASEPDIQKPLNIAFDVRGRLWVTDTIEYPFPANPGTKARDTVKILEDLDGDGKADKFTTFADGLNIPVGVLPLRDGAIVFSIPKLHRMWDTDGDWKADKAEPLYGDVDNRDTHGLTNSFQRALDGWVYACHGFSNHSVLTGADGHSITMISGNLYRMREDGSRVEMFVWGHVNPFGLSFDPLMNLYSADCHSKPVTLDTRGAWHSSFSRPHDGLGFAPDLITHSHGSTAISGVAYYDADHFPPQYRDTTFICNCVTRRVNHDAMQVRGSGYRGIEQPDFVISHDPWFRPVYTILGPDGALYIVDFYNCIIGHYEVPLTHPKRDRHRGRIWRVTWVGEDGKAPPPRRPPDFTKMSLDQLIGFLRDENLTARYLANHEITDRFGAEAAEPVRRLMNDKHHPRQRAHGLWILFRLGALDVELVDRLSKDPDRVVRVHLVRSLAERKDWDQHDALFRHICRRGLKDPDAVVRRVSAEVLGVRPDPEDVKHLLHLWENAPADDVYLVHTIRIALRSILRDHDIFTDLLARYEDRKDHLDRLAGVSLGVPTAKSASFVFECFRRGAANPEWIELLHHVPRWLPANELPDFYKWLDWFKDKVPDVQMAALQSISTAHHERQAPLPAPLFRWSSEIAVVLLRESNKDSIMRGIQLARAYGRAELFDELLRLVNDRKTHPEPRHGAMDALQVLGREKAIPAFARILADRTEHIDYRRRAAVLLGGIDNPLCREKLSEALPTAPYKLALGVAEGLAVTHPGAELLLNAVKEGKASAWLLADQGVRSRFNAIKRPDLIKQIEEITKDMPPVDPAVTQLIRQRWAAYVDATKEHDLKRGKEVFKETCQVCHKVENEGENVGPQLDGIGERGLERILEDTLDPNRNLDPLFRATLIRTEDERIISGLVLREEGNLLVIRDADQEQHIPIDEIEERQITNQSPMPRDIAESLPPDDFNALIAYLLSLKAKE